MTWSRFDLSQCGIFYDDHIPSADSPFPRHAEILRASMLDFSCSILSIDKNSTTPGQSRLEAAENNWQRSGTDPAIKRAYGAWCKAVATHQGGYSEKVWQTELYNTWFFEPLKQAASQSPDSFRRYSRCNYYYDGFKTEGELPWTLFDGREDKNDTSPLRQFERAKCPKPDYTCYLPIYHLDSEPHLPKVDHSEESHWHQSPNHPLVEQFSWTVLKGLRKYGLEPTTSKVFHKDPVEASLKCYPWLIVEHKKEYPEIDNSIRETVYCQAANAAACAIKLNQLAARYAVSLTDAGHVPPVPAITTVGAEVNVWIMHLATDFEAVYPRQFLRDTEVRTCRKGYIMRPVWKGNMRQVEDVAKFQLILENIHTWAMRVFRPTISSYIDLWRNVHSNLQSETGLGEENIELRETQNLTMERCSTVLPMIQSFMDNSGSLELSQSGKSKMTPLLIGMLFQSIADSERQKFTSDVDRILNDKLRGLGLARHRTTAEPDQASQREGTDTTARQDSPLSEVSSVASDDPRDEDYEDSQPVRSGQGTSPKGSPSEVQESFRRSTRSNPGPELDNQSSCEPTVAESQSSPAPSSERDTMDGSEQGSDTVTSLEDDNIEPSKQGKATAVLSEENDIEQSKQGKATVSFEEYMRRSRLRNIKVCLPGQKVWNDDTAPSGASHHSNTPLSGDSAVEGLSGNATAANGGGGQRPSEHDAVSGNTQSTQDHNDGQTTAAQPVKPTIFGLDAPSWPRGFIPPQGLPVLNWSSVPEPIPSTFLRDHRG
ncbi:hypothetical protein B0I35DRAFT_426680 [Stachybotrys elegans]|uniref:Uncharacterized protein n=1 Tax=Stachybotrys elegans TaxID=80388 RepID=A0A8K0SXG8_9HYPO|nr:hypothetical protein B0I35DRAFT_426680 [Stachybotrys elegans]